MLAWWLRLLLIAELALYAALATNLHACGWTWWAIGLTVVALASQWRATHALASFTMAAWFRHQDARREPPGLAYRALKAEFIARLTSFNWSQPFPGFALPLTPRRDTTVGDEMPILLVHGYFSNRGMWVCFAERLAGAGHHAVYAIDFTPPFGSIVGFADQLAARVEAVCRESGASQVRIIAHSMGGIVVRVMLWRHQAVLTRVASVITLGSPHHGTRMATFGLGRCVREMRRASALLQALKAYELQSPPAMPWVSIHTRQDDLVYPPESADLPYAHNIAVEGVGHVSLLYSAPVFRVVEAELARLVSDNHETEAKK